ncbi:MAG: archaeal proteasome endopeptidase complex subunit alpha [Nanoarchaeota archaeon]|nr:archaeal proteasome endopeptidase complex subunit alpha [Nanoarchaeota archaeon]MBU4086325.1 archaeal proteasome endopeptidase complex subunit alpha [Nanoarchaeota archaeon]
MDMPMEMQNQVMGYDRAATIFSPDGHLIQVEYAEKTVRLGSSSIGIVCKDGVVIVADKRMKDPLVIADPIGRISEIDKHILVSSAGIASDARILIERAQVVSQQHRVTYDSDVDVESIVKDIANIKQQFTQYGGARPFGVSLMVAGNSGKKPKLFVTDVTGNYASYKAAAIGENDEKIREELRMNLDREMDIEEAIKLSLKIFKEILGKNFSVERFDAAYIKIEEGKIIRLNGEHLKKYIK